jgi:hypothetical protein
VKRLHPFVVLMVCVLLLAPAVMAAKKAVEEEAAEEKDILSAGTFTGLQFRELGPAVASGRISEIAMDPRNQKIYYGRPSTPAPPGPLSSTTRGPIRSAPWPSIPTTR